MRVFFRRSSEHHSRNDSSSSTSWSHDSHVLCHSRTLVVPGTFLRVLYNNIHHHVAFARELEEKEKNTEQDQPAVRFIFHLVMEWSIHAETERPRVKKADVGISHQTENEKEFWYTYHTFSCSTRSRCEL